MKSFDAFLMCCHWFKQQNVKVINFYKRNEYKGSEDVMFFCRKVLDFPQTEEQGKSVREHLKLADDEFIEYIQKVPVHTWAGNVQGTRTELTKRNIKKHMEHCRFINDRVINVRWDGSIVGCCFDFENENELGTIYEYEHLDNRLEKYKLCRYCDSNWAVQGV